MIYKQARYDCVQVLLRHVNPKKSEMYGSILIFTQNLAVSGANQVLVNLVQGRFMKGTIFVISPVPGPLERIFRDAGAIVVIGECDAVLFDMRDVRVAICNTVMTARVIGRLVVRRIPHFWILHEWWDFHMIADELRKRNMTDMTVETFREAMESCMRVVCVCEAQRQLYGLESSASVIRVGVPISPKRSALNAPPPHGQDVTKFLCMGIICPRKNQVALVEIFREFARDRSDVSLTLVGARSVREYEIEYLEELRDAIGSDSRVSVHEVTDDPWKYYSEADVLILASLNEVTPLVIPEAMLAELPVVTTNIAGIPEMVRHGVDGFVLDPEDKQGFMEAMEKLSNNKNLRTEMGKSGREFALKNFSLGHMVRQYARLARSVAPITVLVDMDGVIVDWDKGFHMEWAARSDVNRSLSYIMQECVPVELKTQAMEITRKPGFFKSLPAVPGAVEAVKHLASLPGFHVLICTSPLLSNPTCVQDKMHWIESHFGTEWLERIIFTRDKTTVRADVLIDDKPDIEGSHHPAWVQLVFDHPYNRHLCKKLFPHRMTAWTDEQLWKPHLLHVLQTVGHSVSHSDLQMMPKDVLVETKEFRDQYALWRKGSHKGASDKLRTRLIKDSEQFEELFILRSQYRQCHYQ